MMKTAEGAVSSTVDILKTLKEKVIGAANDDKTDSDRLTIQKELNQSIDQIDDNALVTFNGKYLVDGSKNTIGEATYTAFSNQKLAANTNSTTKLTNLANRNNESLEIATTDKVTVSYVSQGKTYSTTFQAGTDSTLQTIFDKAEAIDTSSHIFAGKDNKSIYAAQNNVADVTALATNTAYKAMTAEAGKAEGFLAQYGSAAERLSAAAADVISAANALITAGNAATAHTHTIRDETAAGAYDETPVTVNSDAVGSVYGGNTVDNVKDALAYISSKAAYLGTNGNGTVTVTDSDDANAIDGHSAQYTLGDITTNAHISGELKALRDAVFNYNGYDITGGVSTVAGAGVVKVSSEAAADMNTTKTSALAAFNAIDDSVYSGFDLSSGFGSDRNGVQTDELTPAGVPYHAKGVVANSAASVQANYASVSGGVDLGGMDAGLSALGNADVISGRIMAMAAYASQINRTELMTGEKVGVAASNDMVKTADGTNAITVTANKDGIGGQISGFNISVSDSEGNVKKSVNASLDSWTETVRAQNKSDDNALSLHVGAAANQSIKVGLTDMRSEALGLKGSDGTKLNISTQTKANAAINVLDNALQKALDQQTTIGAVESRLEYTSSNLTTSSENVQASESTIRDADMAREMTEYTKNNVLLQAAQSMLAQANQNSSAVLSLLQ
jgi:flagellin